MDRDRSNIIKFLIFGGITITLFGLIYFELCPMINDSSWEKKECDYTKQNNNFALYFTDGCSKLIKTSNPEKQICWINIQKSNCDIVFTQPKTSSMYINLLFTISILGTYHYLSELWYP